MSMRFTTASKRNGAVLRLSVVQPRTAAARWAGSVTVSAGILQPLVDNQFRSILGQMFARTATGGETSRPSACGVNHDASQLAANCLAAGSSTLLLPASEAISFPNVHLPSVEPQVDGDPVHAERHGSCTTERSRMINSFSGTICAIVGAQG